MDKKTVVNFVAGYFAIDSEDLFGDSCRKTYIMTPKRFLTDVLFELIRSKTDVGLFLDVDHSTVISRLRSHRDSVEVDRHYRKQYLEFRETLSKHLGIDDKYDMLFKMKEIALKEAKSELVVELRGLLMNEIGKNVNTTWIDNLMKKI